MPLLLSALKTPPGLPGAGGADYPATRTDCAQAWADAIEVYATGIVPPSTTVAAAAATLASALDAAFASGDAAGPMEAALAAFATTVGAGMAGYTPTPPAGSVGFASLFAGAAPSTKQAGVDAVADLIHAWLTTGVSTLIASPFTVVSWS